MRFLILGAAVFMAGCASLVGMSEVLGCESDSDSICIEITKGRVAHQMTADEFEAMLMRHEGFRANPYDDNGFVSVGYGRNLITNGLTEEEALYLLRNDVARVATELASRYPVVNELNPTRYYVLVSMAYNMGVSKLGTFDKMWKNIEKRDWTRAALEIYLSKYCEQVGNRCGELAHLMETGEYTG